MGKWSNAKWLATKVFGATVEVALENLLPIAGAGVIMWTWLRHNWDATVAAAVGIFVILAYVGRYARVLRSKKAKALDEGSFTIATPNDSVLVRAIAIPREISFQYFEHGNDRMFRVRCTVDFYGPRNTAPSPSLLLLKTRGTGYELARMRIQDGIQPVCPCQLDYKGEGHWLQLNEAAQHTMPRDPGRGNQEPWATVPPGGVLYCNLELHLPDGPDSGTHHESGVRFPFQLAGQYCKPITVRIDPWISSNEHTPSVTLL